MLSVKVIPSSAKNQVAGIMDNALKVRIRKAPEKGKANRELIAFLAEIMGLPRKKLHIIRGKTLPMKKLLLSDISLAQTRKIFQKYTE